MEMPTDNLVVLGFNNKCKIVYLTISFPGIKPVAVDCSLSLRENIFYPLMFEKYKRLVTQYVTFCKQFYC